MCVIDWKSNRQLVNGVAWRVISSLCRHLKFSPAVPDNVWNVYSIQICIDVFFNLLFID
jgi:hypothetical protein